MTTKFPSHTSHTSHASDACDAYDACEGQSAEDKLLTKCSICGKLWANHEDWEYTLHAQEEMERGDV